MKPVKQDKTLRNKLLAAMTAANAFTPREGRAFTVCLVQLEKLPRVSRQRVTAELRKMYP